MKIGNIEVYGVIYKITNIVNGKVYIGQTTVGFDKRHHTKNEKFLEKHHNEHLLKSVKKYGINNFIFSKEFDIAFSKKELDMKEEIYIDYYQSYKREKGYNIRLGGDSSKLGEESKKKLSMLKLGLDITEIEDEILDMYCNKNKYIVEISEYFGIGDWCVSKVLKEHNVKIKTAFEHEYGYSIIDYKEKIIELAKSGLNATEIIKELNLNYNYSTVRRYLVKWGVATDMSTSKKGRNVGKQNLETKQVDMYNKEGVLIKSFISMKECSLWLLEQGLVLTEPSARNQINTKNSKEKLFKNKYYFVKHKSKNEKSRATTE